MVSSDSLRAALSTALICAICRASGEDVPRIQTVLHVQRNLPIRAEPLEYNVALTLLDDDLDRLNGRVDILVKFHDAESPFASWMNKVTKKLHFTPDEYKPIDRFVIHINKSIEILALDLVATKSLEDARNGLGDRLAVKELLSDGVEPLVAIRLVKNVPTGFYARLSIKYKASHLGELIQTGKLKHGQNIHTYRAIRLKPEQASGLFPCIDEPQLKAKMSLEVSLPNLGSSVISATPLAEGAVVKDAETGLELSRLKFRQTEVAVPVHSLTFAVGSFPSEEFDSSSGVCVHELPGRQGEGRFALDFSLKAIKWLEAYLQTAHPLQSLELVPVPANDRWNVSAGLGIGLINHEFLLINEKLSSPERKIEAALNVALVVARQWFGNVLVPKSSDDLWITEGMAAYLAIRCARELMPELQVDQYVRTHHFTQVLREQLRLGMNPEFLPDDTRSEATRELTEMVKGVQIIDLIRRSAVNNKGRFDKIMRSLVGDQAQTGINQTDLAQIFADERAPQKRIEDILGLMNRDTSNAVLGVYEASPDQPWIQARHIRLERGFWPLSMKIHFSSADGKRTSRVDVGLNERLDIIIDVPMPTWFDADENSGDWYKVLVDDAQTLAYHQVSMQDKTLTRLGKPIEKLLLSSVERLDVITNVLAWWEERTYDVQFGFDHARLVSTLQFYQNERDADVALQVLSAFTKYHSKQPGHNKDILMGLLKRIYKNLGGCSPIGPNSFGETRLKSAALKLLVQLGEPQVVKEALATFDLVGDELPGYMREAVYMAISRAGTDEQRQKLAAKLERSDHFEERLRLLKALNRAE